MPFGKYKDFNACVLDNQDKESPGGYCASLHKQITGEWPTQKEMFGFKESIPSNILDFAKRKVEEEYEKAHNVEFESYKEAYGIDYYILQKDCFVGKKGDIIKVDEKGESSTWHNLNRHTVGSPFVEYDLVKKITEQEAKKILGSKFESYEADTKYKNMSIKQAKELLGDRADWELKNMKKALTSMRLMNSEEEEKRLAAVKVLLKNKESLKEFKAGDKVVTVAGTGVINKIEGNEAIIILSPKADFPGQHVQFTLDQIRKLEKVINKVEKLHKKIKGN